MSEPDADSIETEAPVRRRIDLARLPERVRKQDWFVVLVQITVVVVGVVIGFQVTEWGQGRADRAKEQVYLRQLAEDFGETLGEAQQASRRQRAVSRSVASALRAYRTLERPPLDSLSVWIGGSYNFQGLTPILGTAQGIVASGDISLIRDDSLRAALPVYVEQSRERRQAVQVSIDLYGAAFAKLLAEMDVLEMGLLRFTPSRVDTLAERDPTFPYPAGARRTPFPATVEDVLSNPEVYGSLVTASFMNGAVSEYQWQVAQDASKMLRLVERIQDMNE